MADLGPVASSEPSSMLVSSTATRPPDQIYIVDDDSMVRRSLSFSLATLGFRTRAFASGRDFLDEVDMLATGCVLLDIRMPGMDGLAVLEELGTRIQRFAVVAMTGHGDVDTAVRAMKRGVRDFLEKPFPEEILLDTLSTLIQDLPGQTDARAEVADAVARMALLTPREQEVLQGLVAGLPNKVLGHKLGISSRTVEMHRSNLMERMRVKSLAEAVRVAISASVKAG